MSLTMIAMCWNQRSWLRESTGIGRPRMWERARYYNEEKRLAAALDAMDVSDDAKIALTQWPMKVAENGRQSSQ